MGISTALNLSLATVAEPFVLAAVRCLLPAVAGSATAFGIATNAFALIMFIAFVSLQIPSPRHSAPRIPYDKPLTATKPSPLRWMCFMRGCPLLARIIQIMNFLVRVANYMGSPLDSPFACPEYSGQILDTYRFSFCLRSFCYTH